ncbi:manganese/zinc/iron transport system permease protein [Arcanobacterium pluranimalium]|uniref:metal ABC transporter permease n=1 Tax=Arcanobacterium pluranimalium TaxID=108028 RepID=UPI003084347D|nr:manganese/zinc/iron transport system permease protein [Arcanobacterium pluranimalium]
MDLIAFLSTHSYRIISIGTFMIGLVCGVLGCFLYVRRQSLLSDVIGHASTLGVMGAFIVASAVFGVDGRSLIVLVIGSVLAALVAVLLSDWIARTTPLGDDTTMAVMLALFYGGGLVLLRVIIHGSFPGKGGISSALLGSATSLTISDVLTIAVLGAMCLVIVVLFRKEFSAFCFDPQFVSVQGFSPKFLTPLLLGPTVVAVVLGVKAVGLILMVAFAIIPPAAARQWANRLLPMAIIAGLVGGLSSVLGTWLSVSLGSVPTGPVIVLILTFTLLFSLVCSPRRSLVMQKIRRVRRRRELQRRIAQEIGAH